MFLLIIDPMLHQNLGVSPDEKFLVLRYLVWFDRGHKSTKSLSGKRLN